MILSRNSRPLDPERGRLLALVVLAFSAFGALTTELAPVGLLPVIGHAFSRPSASAGMTVSLFALMVMLFSVPLAFITRNASGRTVVLIAITGYVICNLLTATAPSFPVLLIARAVGGIAHALFFSACIGQTTRLATPGRTSRAFAIVAAGVSGGYVLGSPLVTAVGDAAGWRTPFIALIALNLAALVLARLFLPAQAASPVPEQKQLGGRRGAIGAIASNGLTFFGQYMLYTYVSVVIVQAGLSQRVVAPVLLLFGVAGLCAVWFTASLLDKHFRWTAVVFVGMIAVSIAGVGVTAAWPAAIIAVIIVWGAAVGPMAAIFQTAATRNQAFAPETVGAWVNTTCNLGIAAGSAIGGTILASGSVQLLSWLATIPILFGAGLLAASTRRGEMR